MLNWLVREVTALWSAVNNAVSIAGQLLSLAVSAAKSAANTAVNTLERWVNAQLQTLETWVIGLWRAAQTTYEALLETAKRALLAAASALVNAAAITLRASIRIVEALAQGAYNFAKGLFADAFELAVRLFQDAIKAIGAAAADVLATARTLINASAGALLKTVLDLFDPLRLAIMPYLGLLTLFLRSPMAFIFAYLKRGFMTWIQYELAWAIARPGLDLGPPPLDTDLGDPGGPIIGDPPPAVGGGLVAPLDHVYVSGHLFSSQHPGIDLGLTMGQAVYAMHDGQVVVELSRETGYGKRLAIEGGPWWTLYAHLQEFVVHQGEYVEAGQLIALGDSTGNSSGPHLHLEIKFEGQYIDPLSVL